jgi:hypothetical protein
MLGSYHIARVLLVFCFLISTFMLKAQMSVNENITPEQLVQDVLLGRGVAVSNIVYQGGSRSVGQFNTTTTDLGMSNGVIISSGLAVAAVGPNTVPNAGEAIDLLNSKTDPDLSPLVPGYLLYDVVFIEFDFIATSNTVEFKYVFGSEEYMEWVNSPYNDVFGFFVTGQNPLGGNYTGLNIARVPTTNEIVSIDNINLNKNAEFYVENENPAGITTQYDGFTKPLTATISVIPGQVYHIKIAVADAGDAALDSGVLLEASSFSSPDCTLPNIDLALDCIGRASKFSIWDESNVVITPVCDGNGSVNVTLVNNGTGDMSVPAEYSVFDFGTAAITKQSYQLTAGESINFTVLANGATIVVGAEQTQYNPINRQTNVTVEVCSVGGAGTVSYEFLPMEIPVVWDFGDGETSAEANPLHTYNTPGNYSVSLSYCDTTIIHDIIIEECPKLKLSSVCSDNPSEIRRWRVRNSNDYDIEARWELLGTSYQGVIQTNANSDTFFETPTAGFNFVKVYIGTELQSLRVSSGQSCEESCTECISSFSPIPTEKYVLTAWVKEADNPTANSYLNPGIALEFPGPETITGPFYANGPLIDGWQRLEAEFIVPEGATSIIVRLTNRSTDKEVYFDDIRIHPFNSNMKSFVYDPVTLRLMAELDERNYATFYEYDEEGALVRVKKETERGVMTIQESRNNTVKQ